MVVSPLKDIPIDQPAKMDFKLRRCLRCGVAFDSEWAGERICSHCKGTAAWRNGTPPRTHSVGGRR